MGSITTNIYVSVSAYYWKLSPACCSASARHTIRYGSQAAQNSINTHHLNNLEKTENPEWEGVGDTQKCPHLQLLLV